MIDFNSAYKKLNDPKSNVSCHYLISRQEKFIISYVLNLRVGMLGFQSGKILKI